MSLLLTLCCCLSWFTQGDLHGRKEHRWERQWGWRGRSKVSIPGSGSASSAGLEEAWTEGFKVLQENTHSGLHVSKLLFLVSSRSFWWQQYWNKVYIHIWKSWAFVHVSWLLCCIVQIRGPFWRFKSELCLFLKTWWHQTYHCALIRARQNPCPLFWGKQVFVYGKQISVATCLLGK